MSTSGLNAVPILDGTNYRDWSQLMESFLLYNELWDILSGDYPMPIEPKPFRRRVTTAASTSSKEAVETTETVQPTAQQMADHRALYVPWKKANDKVLGAITLKLAPHLRHHRDAAARTTWDNLKRTFGATSMPTIFADFRQVIQSRLRLRWQSCPRDRAYGDPFWSPGTQPV